MPSAPPLKHYMVRVQRPVSSNKASAKKENSKEDPLSGIFRRVTENSVPHKVILSGRVAC